MKIWRLQEAKSNLTQLIKDADIQPQIISEHGKKEIVVLSYKQYQSLIGDKENLVEFFRKSPLSGVSLTENIRDKCELKNTKL